MLNSRVLVLLVTSTVLITSMLFAQNLPKSSKHNASESKPVVADLCPSAEPAPSSLDENTIKAISQAETRARCQVVQALDRMPQRLLSDAAKQEIKDSLNEEIKSQIAELRADLQKQIDDLKSRLPPSPPAESARLDHQTQHQ